MAHYVNSLPSLSTYGCCNIPGRESLCFSLALVGILCLAAALALVFRADSEVVCAPIRLGE